VEQEVGGSSPPNCTNNFKYLSHFTFIRDLLWATIGATVDGRRAREISGGLLIDNVLARAPPNHIATNVLSDRDMKPRCAENARGLGRTMRFKKWKSYRYSPSAFATGLGMIQ
jgi:hypothetical protein